MPQDTPTTLDARLRRRQDQAVATVRDAAPHGLEDAAYWLLRVAADRVRATIEAAVREEQNIRDGDLQPREEALVETFFAQELSAAAQQTLDRLHRQAATMDPAVYDRLRRAFVVERQRARQRKQPLLVSFDSLGIRRDVDELGQRLNPAEARQRDEARAAVSHKEALLRAMGTDEDAARRAEATRRAPPVNQALLEAVAQAAAEEGED